MVDVKHRVIATRHFRRYRQYHFHLLLFDFFLIVFSGICCCETDACACIAHHTKLALECLSQKYNNVMSSLGIKVATLQSLTRLNNQFLCAAVYFVISQVIARSKIKRNEKCKIFNLDQKQSNFWYYQTYYESIKR